MPPTVRPIALGAALAACALLAACTPSVSPTAPADPFSDPIVPNSAIAEAPQSRANGVLGAPTPIEGRGTVKVAVLPGATLPASVESAFHDATGFTIDQDAIDSASRIPGVGADVAFGLDASDLLGAKDAFASAPAIDAPAPEGTAVEGAASEIAYGRDDVCVLADKAWMSANRRSLPSGLDALATPELASLLAIPDPTTSETGALFVAAARAKYGEGLGEWAKALKEGGALVASGAEADSAWTALEGPQSGEAPTRPLLVAPMSAIARTATASGVEAAGVALEGTCAKRVVYAAPAAAARNEAGAQSLLAWLLTWQGQRALAEAGVVHPLDETALEGTPAHWFLAPLADSTVLDEAALAQSGEAAALWTAGLGG